MKRVKMSPPKEGKLYPTIDFDSDRCESVLSTDTQDTLNDSYESTATTTVSEVPSLGKEIVMVARHDRQESELTPIPEDNNDSMDTDDGERLTDSVLEDALGLDDVDEYDDRPTPPKVVKTSSSSSGSDRVGRSVRTGWAGVSQPPPGSSTLLMCLVMQIRSKRNLRLQ